MFGEICVLQDNFVRPHLSKQERLDLDKFALLFTNYDGRKIKSLGVLLKHL